MKIYDAKWINSANNKTYPLSSFCAFDIDGMSGYDVNIKSAQGFNQIGETVQNLGVKSQNIDIKGAVFNDNPHLYKRVLCEAFAPLTSGQLIINDKYFINAVVKKSPTVHPVQNQLKFSLQLSAPYPYFREIRSVELSNIERTSYANFRFHTKFNPHSFTKHTTHLEWTSYNRGDIPAPMEITFRPHGKVVNPRLICSGNGQMVGLVGNFDAGDEVVIYKTDENVLQIMYDVQGAKGYNRYDILDERSEFFELPVGKTDMKLDSDGGTVNLEVILKFNRVYAGVFDEI